MHPLAARRLRGYLLDCTGYLGIAAAMLPLGAVVAVTTDLGRRPLYGHLISAVPPAIATVVAARAESGAEQATWGKRRQGLQVSGPDGAQLSFGRALGRNTVKIFVPWQLGHLTALGAARGGFDRRDPVTLSATAATYALIGVHAWTGLRGSGRGVHDLVAGSRVTAAVSPRRTSSPSFETDVDPAGHLCSGRTPRRQPAAG